MELPGHNYVKGDGRLDMRPQQAKWGEQPFSRQGNIAIQASGLGYTKEQPTLDATIFFILSGGEATELSYFRPLKKARRVKIAIASKGRQGLTPSQLNERANECLSAKVFMDAKGDAYHIEHGDTIYLLQDVDEYEAEILQCMPLYDNRARWIVSNPCFEVWSYYHYFSDPGQLCDGLSVPLQKRSQWLTNKLNDLIPGGISPEKEFFKIAVAINNSMNNYTVKPNGIPDVFSTQMHILATEICQSLSDELQEMISKRNANIAMYRHRFT